MVVLWEWGMQGQKSADLAPRVLVPRTEPWDIQGSYVLFGPRERIEHGLYRHQLISSMTHFIDK